MAYQPFTASYQKAENSKDKQIISHARNFPEERDYWAIFKKSYLRQTPGMKNRVSVFCSGFSIREKLGRDCLLAFTVVDEENTRVKTMRLSREN
jgi:hypothetical protein